MANGRGVPPGDGHVVRFPYGQSPSRRTPIEPFEAFSPGEWYGKPAPAHDWMVEGCLLRGTVGMLSGDGGIGKSLIMQQLLTAASIGKDWLGLGTQRGKGFGFFCEDDKDELHRRQERINEQYDCDHPDLDLLYISRVGMENVLMEFDRRTDRVLPTPLWDQLQQTVIDFGAQYLVIDTIADAYGGNEIVRNQVRRFITELRRLAVQMQGSIIITAHPSLTGMNSGTGLSGSTAWHNSVRSRMYLTKPKGGSNGEEEDTDDEAMNARVLRTMKNNQGPGAGRINLRWENGVFLREDVPAVEGIVERLTIDNVVLEYAATIVKQGNRIAAGTQHSKCLASQLLLFTKIRKAYKRGDLIAAQDRLLGAGKLVAVAVGPPSRRYTLIRPADLRYAEET
jgi:RecA-family ATPase